MEIEEAAEIVLDGENPALLCRKCGGTGSSFKGGMSVGTYTSKAMYTEACTKCNGLGRVRSPRYEEARALLGLPPSTPRR